MMFVKFSFAIFIIICILCLAILRFGFSFIG